MYSSNKSRHRDYIMKRRVKEAKKAHNKGLKGQVSEELLIAI